MSKLLEFPTAPQRFGFQPVKSHYTVREISHLFGLTQQQIRKWSDAGLVKTVSGERGAMGSELAVSSDSPLTAHHPPLYGFRALAQFRRVRELRDQGLSPQQIEHELRGQFNLFASPEAQLVYLPLKPSLFERALELHEKGDSSAAEMYRCAIRADDCMADAYCNLGILEHEAGSLPNARECFSLSIDREEKHFESHYNIGTLYFDEDQLELSRIHYEMAAHLEPSFPNTYYNLGLVHAQLEKWEDARRTLRRYQQLASADEQPSVLVELLRGLDQVCGMGAQRGKATPLTLVN